jgi:hypothetical protein
LELLNLSLACHKKQRAKHLATRGASRAPHERVAQRQKHAGGRPSLIPHAMGQVLELWVKACRRGKFKVPQGIARAKMQRCLWDTPGLE